VPVRGVVSGRPPKVALHSAIVELARLIGSVR
jgi:hypothetical protein